MLHVAYVESSEQEGDENGVLGRELLARHRGHVFGEDSHEETAALR